MMTNLAKDMFLDVSLKQHLFWSQKLKGRCRKSHKHCRRRSLHSYECWLLLVTVYFQKFISIDFPERTSARNVKELEVVR